jgi:hypothetical protein
VSPTLTAVYVPGVAAAVRDRADHRALAAAMLWRLMRRRRHTCAREDSTPSRGQVRSGQCI